MTSTVQMELVDVLQLILLSLRQRNIENAVAIIESLMAQLKAN